MPTPQKLEGENNSPTSIESEIMADYDSKTTYRNIREFILGTISKIKNAERQRIQKAVEGINYSVPSKPKEQPLTEEYINKLLVYVGRFNYDKAIKDVLSIINNEK